ncbi:hypothetical protein [Kribbella sp. VKM Ac-2568]|uniref:hypothetical protein n=1 Tax=Kribbella sp. VKM Ac-2568 TaxID=2512219 RepID=UPI001045773D|nr:hypothetical protein [Kribbella sp. VKM Ac-2568]TCM33224.1 hypothetical protein EV648_1315 [Kribbella sp. VKM Ac-2568]
MEDSERHAGKSYSASQIANSQVLQGDNSTISVARLSSDDNVELRTLFTKLDSEIANTALTAAEREDATKQASDLKAAITRQDAPDVSRMHSIVSWFKAHIPTLVGAVLSVVVNPIVGQLVSAGGDLLVQEFNGYFAKEQPK